MDKKKICNNSIYMTLNLIVYIFKIKPNYIKKKKK